MVTTLSAALLSGDLHAVISGMTERRGVLSIFHNINLGRLQPVCRCGMHEAVWAAILLMMFHAVSNHMFLSVGAVENCTRQEY